MNITKFALVLFAVWSLLFVRPMVVKAFRKTPVVKKEVALSMRRMSLETRYSNEYVNDVFKKNILLTLQYMNGSVEKNKAINWSTVSKPMSVNLKLNPNEIFAFHDIVLPEYENKVNKTIGVDFNSYEGFLSDGFLVGDGVCHLASIMNWAARDAGLEVLTPTNHDFANIPEVPREYGVAIYTSSAQQNMYIKNNKKSPIVMKIRFDGKNLSVSVVKTAAKI